MRQTIQATRPESCEPIPEKEIYPCPKCKSKNRVRILENWKGLKKYFCSDCLQEFEVYKACDDLDLTLTGAQLTELVRMWKVGVPLGEMAHRLRKDPDLTAILVLDLARRGRIGKRPGGYHGELKKFTPTVREMLGGNSDG
jgi:DNA-directed RNA polymerase subunit RPC12/RpoP